MQSGLERPGQDVDACGKAVACGSVCLRGGRVDVQEAKAGVVDLVCVVTLRQGCPLQQEVHVVSAWSLRAHTHTHESRSQAYPLSGMRQQHTANQSTWDEDHPRVLNDNALLLAYRALINTIF